MPHGYFFLSDEFAKQHPEFPRRPQVMIDGIAEMLGEDPKKVELFRFESRPLSEKPLDIELKIEVDTLQIGSGPIIHMMAAKNIRASLRALDEVPESATFGVWLRSGECGVFVGEEEPDT